MKLAVAFRYKHRRITNMNKLLPFKARRPPFDFLAIGVFFLVLLCSKIFPPNIRPILFVALAIAVLPYSRIRRNFWQIVWPLSAILVLGIPGFVEHEFRNIARDFFFGLSPIALLIIGFWLAGRKHFFDQLPIIIVSLGVLFAVQHLFQFVLSPSLLLEDSMEVRSSTQGGANITVLALLVLFFIDRFSIERPPIRGLAFVAVLLILITSVIFTYSRTSMIILLVGSLAAKGWLSGRNLKWILMAFGAVLATLFTMPEDAAFRQDLTFISKFFRIGEEMKISNYEDSKAITLNWRGFESYMALEQYLSGNAMQLVIGQGYGSLVDLGFVIPLGGDGSINFRHIPVFHNGYLYVLLKYGFAGVLLYIAFYFRLIKIALEYQNSTSRQTVFYSHFLLGLILSLILLMFVVGGMAQLAATEYVVLLGVMVSRILNEKLSTQIRKTQLAS